MWGFLTCLNDILVPHLKSIFDLSYAKVMLIQFTFFSAYFFFSIPAAKIVDGSLQRTMVVVLLVMGAGAFLFVPAAIVPSYPLFLTASLCWPPESRCCKWRPIRTHCARQAETASSRLNLTQAFNSLGTTIAPKIGGLLF